MNKATLIVVLVVIVGVAGYLVFKNIQKPAETVQEAPPQNQTATVSIGNFAFNPATLQVKVGATVIWTNNDVAPHTITSTGFASSGIMAGGQTFSHIFTQPGEYDYSCSIHPTMKGKIVVTQ